MQEYFRGLDMKIAELRDQLEQLKARRANNNSQIIEEADLNE